jgi:hypothetical protein
MQWLTVALKSDLFSQSENHCYVAKTAFWQPSSTPNSSLSHQCWCIGSLPCHPIERLIVARKYRMVSVLFPAGAWLKICHQNFHMCYDDAGCRSLLWSQGFGLLRLGVAIICTITITIVLRMMRVQSLHSVVVADFLSSKKKPLEIWCLMNQKPSW